MKRASVPLAWLTGAAVGVTTLLSGGPAAAEIVGWVDDTGKVTYTNMAPPKGAKVVDRIAEERSEPRARAVPDPWRDEELRSLNDRVRDLEGQLRQASRTPPDWQPPVSYEQPAPLASSGCDGWVYDCTGWTPGWIGPVYYTYGRGYGPRFHHADHPHGGFVHPPRHEAPRVAQGSFRSVQAHHGGGGSGRR